MSAAEFPVAGQSRVVTAARQMLSAKAERFTESVIREMTRLAMQHNAVNMAQGFPDFPASPKSRRPRGRPSLTTSISTPLPGARRNCATPLRGSLSGRRACAWIPSARSPLLAARPKP